MPGATIGAAQCIFAQPHQQITLVGLVNLVKHPDTLTHCLPEPGPSPARSPPEHNACDLLLPKGQGKKKSHHWGMASLSEGA